MHHFKGGRREKSTASHRVLRGVHEDEDDDEDVLPYWTRPESEKNIHSFRFHFTSGSQSVLGAQLHLIFVARGVLRSSANTSSPVQTSRNVHDKLLGAFGRRRRQRGWRRDQCGSRQNNVMRRTVK